MERPAGEAAGMGSRMADGEGILIFSMPTGEIIYLETPQAMKKKPAGDYRLWNERKQHGGARGNDDLYSK